MSHECKKLLSMATVDVKSMRKILESIKRLGCKQLRLWTQPKDMTITLQFVDEYIIIFVQIVLKGEQMNIWDDYQEKREQQFGLSIDSINESLSIISAQSDAVRWDITVDESGQAYLNVTVGTTGNNIVNNGGANKKTTLALTANPHSPHSPHQQQITAASLKKRKRNDNTKQQQQEEEAEVEEEEIQQEIIPTTTTNRKRKRGEPQQPVAPPPAVVSVVTITNTKKRRKKFVSVESNTLAITSSPVATTDATSSQQLAIVAAVSRQNQSSSSSGSHTSPSPPYHQQLVTRFRLPLGEPPTLDPLLSLCTFSHKITVDASVLHNVITTFHRSKEIFSEFDMYFDPSRDVIAFEAEETATTKQLQHAILVEKMDICDEAVNILKNNNSSNVPRLTRWRYSTSYMFKVTRDAAECKTTSIYFNVYNPIVSVMFLFSGGEIVDTSILIQHLVADNKILV